MTVDAARARQRSYAAEAATRRALGRLAALHRDEYGRLLKEERRLRGLDGKGR